MGDKVLIKCCVVVPMDNGSLSVERRNFGHCSQRAEEKRTERQTEIRLGHREQ